MISLSLPSIQTNPALQSSLLDVLRVIDTAQTFCLTSHINSDGDSLGSELALKALLESAGKHVYCINPSHVPDNLQFLTGSRHIRVYNASSSGDAALLASVDVLIILDGNSPSRMRGMEEAILGSPAKKIVIDHHQDPAPFADLYAIDTDACSTAEIIFRLAMLMQENTTEQQYITKTVAEALYTGIMTDTGNFRFPRTDSDVHRIIAYCIDVGVEPYDVFDNVYNHNPINRARLLGETLQRLQTFHDGKLCIMRVTDAMMRANGTNVDHVEGFVEQCLGIQGVQMGALIVELPNQIKISLRSKGALPVNTIAARFGGGGHVNAAGCRTTALSLQEVEQKIIDDTAPLFMQTT